MPTPLKIAGLKYGRLTAIKDVGRGIHGRIWLCWCDCGGEARVPASRLVAGHTRSCGCLGIEASKKAKRWTHGQTRNDVKAQAYEYNIWQSMKQRCLNPKNKGFARYGGRGITIDPAWLGANGFQTFLAQMGKRPSAKHSLERRDRDGNYTKTNCKWALPIEQQNNRKGNRFITHDGRTMSASDWAREVGINAGSIRNRLDMGWTVERSLTEPLRPRSRRT